MSVADENTIDGMGISNDGKRAVLLISDHLAWDDDTHLPLIERKIGSYLHFVGSGQLAQQLPQAGELPVDIELKCRFEPEGRAIAFLEAAKTQLNEMGVGFSYGLLPPGY